MDSCNYKTLNRTGRFDPNHASVIKNSVGPGYDLGKTNCSAGGFGTLGTAYSNNGNGCRSGRFVQRLCGNQNQTTLSNQNKLF